MPYNSITLRLTDGQHRCFGIRQAFKEVQVESSVNLARLAELEIGALIYAALPLEMERQAFRDQNLLAQRPGKSLSHLFDTRSPEVAIAKELCKRVPQFRSNIEMVENGLGKYNHRLMTLSTLVTATQHMFPHLHSENNLELRIDWATTFWTERKQQREESMFSATFVIS